MNKPLVAALATLALVGASISTAAAVQADPAHSDPAHSPGSPTRTVSVHRAPAGAARADTARTGTTRTGTTLTGTAPRATTDFSGIVALDDCSGSLIRVPASSVNDPALVLTNGHCLETGMPTAGQVIVNQASSRTFTLLKSNAAKAGTLRATKVDYATMTDTDITIYQLNATYAQIEQRYGVKPLTLSPDHPAAGTSIAVVSGYWKTVYACGIDGFAYQLHEADWVWKDSVRYTSACHTIGGTSGSPVEDVATGQVVAVNNTLNEDGQRCSLDNPCEVDQNGQVTVHEGIGYAEETYGIVPCVAQGNTIDLSLPGCTLPKPS
ncbi:serine protease [Streptomyces sp. PTM05]|uniref:Serine protease n=1 Tax=Streptantibioticus parmotrematis TaxID=2873249 RepID=A0ABS7QTJ1_9ACTN|nr:serine protease [Streptantibioticus parmotrematis]MBY8885119.1 serine protease [Streptantibioticus parmotrematis]